MNTLTSWLNTNGSSTESKTLRDLVSALDYYSMDEFINDNPALFEVITNWMEMHLSDVIEEKLSIPLRDDIQRLLDLNIIQLEDELYVLTTTNYAVIARFNDKSHLVGSIEVLGDTITLFDENDNRINGGENCDFLEAFKMI